MDIAVLYEKVDLPSTDNKIFMLKPVGVTTGKYNKRSRKFEDKEEGQVYYDYNNKKKLLKEKYFIGYPISMKDLKDETDEDIDVNDVKALTVAYMQNFVCDVIFASISDNQVVTKTLDLELVDKGIIIDSDEGTDIDTGEEFDLNIAILYEKEEIEGAPNPTYMMKPINTIYGYCNSKGEFIGLEDNETYLPMHGKDELSRDEAIYYGNNIAVKDIAEFPEFENEEQYEAAYDELAEKYFSSFSRVYSCINQGKNGLVSADIDIDLFTFQSGHPNKESEKDVIVTNAIDSILAITDDEIDDDDKFAMMEFYRTLAKFLFVGEELEGVTLDEVTVNTYTYARSAFYELKNVIAGLNIRQEIADMIKETFDGGQDIEEIKSACSSDKALKTTKKGVSEVVADKTLNYDPNKVKFPEYSIEDLYKGITDVVVAQDEQVMQIVSILYKRLVELEIDDAIGQFGMLITGSTGVGKSEILKTFAKVTGLPIQFMDATQLTAAGYKGRDIDDYLAELATSCKGNFKKLLKAIIILDEVDKIRATGDSLDVSGKAVQDLMLKFMDGTTYQLSYGDNTIAVDTSKMTTISAGAFSDLYNTKKKTLGFNKPVDAASTVGTEDFIRFGMSDEFMGRHYNRIHLNDLDVNALVRILNESSKSPLKLQQAIFSRLGVEAIFTDGYKKAVAEEAIKRKIGARALTGIVGESTWLPINEIDSHRGEYNKLILDEETVKDAKQFVLRRD